MSCKPRYIARRAERAIGAVYSSDTELTSRYFQTILPDQFDAYIWFEQTAGGRSSARSGRYLSVRNVMLDA